jgi:CBS domain-containing protein
MDARTAAQDSLTRAVTPAQYLDAAHRHIVQTATMAPSVHNSQPWRFTDDVDGLDLYADDSRRLAVLDPTGRQVHLSCGAALQHAQVAARSLGFDAAADLLPEPHDPSHLARLHLTAGAPCSPAERALADATRSRHTHRGAFDPAPLPPALLEELRCAAEAQGARLKVLDEPNELVELEVLLSWADGLEVSDPAYLAELAASVHTGPSDDGIPSAALPDDAQRGSSLRSREFAPGSRTPTADGPPAAEHPAVVVVVTEGDDARSWLTAGRAMSAVLLHAAAAGVMAQPLGQVTDFPATRLKLRAALTLAGTPQVALRLGLATGTVATPRRPVDDVLAPADPVTEPSSSTSAEALDAGEVMTSDPATVTDTTTVGEAMRLMRSAGVRHLPVLTEGRLAGVVDDRLVAVALLTDPGFGAALERPVTTVMAHDVAQIAAATDLRRVAELLGTSSCDALVVVDVSEHPIGIVTMVDVVGAVARHRLTRLPA